MLTTMLREMARRRHSHDDAGATAVEYALLVGLIAMIAISAVALLGGNIDAMFDDIVSRLGVGAP